MRRSPRKRSWSLLVILFAAAGGCSFIADEFVWLDRAAAASEVVTERPTDGLASPH